VSAEPVRLHPDSVDDVARRVLELLEERDASQVGRDTPEPVGGLLTAAQVAQRLGVSVYWVREHAADLAVRLGDGKRPRLRWHPDAVHELTRRSTGERSLVPDPPPPRPQPRRRTKAARESVHGLPFFEDST
jgi:hypothetical protein